MDRRSGLLLSLPLLLAGCGGGLPLLHPAHVLPPGEIRTGAGLSGQIALLAAAPSTEPAALRGERIDPFAVAPAIAPWVNARIGIANNNEAGLTYAGRSIRLDGRHAFSLGGPTLSLGLGASAVVAERPGLGVESIRGGGIDVPLLFGLKSTSDLYAIWLGPRAGLELLRGRLLGDSPKGIAPVDVSARHIFAGFVAGVRAGFRHIHVALELDGSYHRADGLIAGAAVSRNQLTLTPGGALLISY
jgi:hypothetical protein